MSQITNATEDTNNCYTYPNTSYYPHIWSYTINNEDKTKKAITILNMLRKSKKIKVESIDTFNELIDKITELL